MKAVIVEQPGGVENLQFRDVDEPQAGDGEVKIRVRAFGLNRAETYYRAGKMGEISGPRIPGIELAGEVVEDRRGRFRPGQKVVAAMGGMMLARHGSHAEYAVVPASNVVAIDTPLPWEELASLPQAYLTVWGALDRNLSIQAGQILLVRGGTTSVGLAAITYARARGLTVLATTRNPDNARILEGAGADSVIIDDGQVASTVRERFPDGVDCALDVIGVATLLDTLAAVRSWGRVCMVGILSGPPVLASFGLMSDLPNTVQLSFFGSGLLGAPQMPLDQAPLDWIAAQVEKGDMPSIRSRTFSFDQIRDAHRIMEANQALGKMVVRL